MVPSYANGTEGPTEIVDAKDVLARMDEMLDRPGVDHVRIRRIGGRSSQSRPSAKTKRRAASKRARNTKR